MSKCFEQNTIKVPSGNSWQMLLPLKTAKWKGNDLITETIDYRALENVRVYIDGDIYTNWQMTEDGPLCDMPSDGFGIGAHSTILMATYYGVEVRAAYFENFTIVAWSFESNVGEHLQESPLISEAAYVYVGITDDEELEALKQQYRDAIAAAETERLAYEAAKDEYTSKTEALDDVAKESSMVQGFDNTLNAIQGISVSDESAHNLAQFFGITSSTAFEAVTEQEIIDELNNLWDISLK